MAHNAAPAPRPSQRSAERWGVDTAALASVAPWCGVRTLHQRVPPGPRARPGGGAPPRASRTSALSTSSSAWSARGVAVRPGRWRRPGSPSSRPALSSAGSPRTAAARPGFPALHSEREEGAGALAARGAGPRRHDIDTEHLLLGVVTPAEGIVASVLAEFGTSGDDMRHRAENILDGRDPGIDGPVERYFEHLSARDWPALGEVLAADVVRVGPLGDEVAGTSGVSRPAGTQRARALRQRRASDRLRP